MFTLEHLARELASRRGLNYDTTDPGEQALIGVVNDSVCEFARTVIPTIPVHPNGLRWLSIFLAAWSQQVLTQPERASESRRFHLQRDTDITGASGTGHVADGVQWPDGTVAMRWRHEHASTVVWSNLESAIAVHGHDGATRLVWDD